MSINTGCGAAGVRTAIGNAMQRYQKGQELAGLIDHRLAGDLFQVVSKSVWRFFDNSRNA